MKGFWDSLIACLNDLHAKGVMRKEWQSYISVADTVDEVMGVVERG